MKTAMKELIGKMKDAKLCVTGADKYSDGYYYALQDIITLSETFLEKEEQQINASYLQGVIKRDAYFEYYKEIYNNNEPI